MTSTAARIIALARAEIGYHEGRSGGHWNNKEKYAAQVPTLAWVSAGGYPWCAVFVCWAFFEAGVLDLIPGGPTAAVEHFRDYGKRAGRFSEYPAVGAIALFGRDGGSHTGIVAAYGPNTITTIEGNTNSDPANPEGDGVYLKTHNRRDAWVYGYVYPTYPEGIDSADPAWAKAKPTAVDVVAKSHTAMTRGPELDQVIVHARRMTGHKKVRATILRLARAVRPWPKRRKSSQA